MEVVIDTLGGDKEPFYAVNAGIQAVDKLNVDIAFVGCQREIDPIISKYYLQNTDLSDRIRIIESTHKVKMDEPANYSIRKRLNTSIMSAMKEVAEGRSQAVVSPGHTGASVIAAMEVLKPLNKIRYPALCQIIPGSKMKNFLLLDIGASTAVTAKGLAKFALIGYAAAKQLLDIADPKVGLLNIGSESGKGNRRLRKAEQLLDKLPINFVGNVEGYDLWNNTADVYVTDAITGNIVLKSAEGLAKLLMKSFIRKNDNQYAIRFDPSVYGGAALLGVNGLCIICHGQAEEKDLFNAISVAKTWFEMNIIENIELQLRQFDQMNYLETQ